MSKAFWSKSLGVLWAEVSVSEEDRHLIPKNELMPRVLRKAAATMADNIIKEGAMTIKEIEEGYRMEMAVLVDKKSLAEVSARIEKARKDAFKEAKEMALEYAKLWGVHGGGIVTPSFALRQFSEILNRKEKGDD